MKYRLIYFIWVLPAYLAFLIGQQYMVYRGTIDTYKNGVSIAADVVDFDVKQIAAQSNGYIVIRFVDPKGTHHEQKLSLSIQMAQKVMENQVIPIRYQSGGFQEIVMVPTYELQKETSLANMGIAFIGFVILVIVSVFATRFANQRATSGNPGFTIERVDV